MNNSNASLLASELGQSSTDPRQLSRTVTSYVVEVPSVYGRRYLRLAPNTRLGYDVGERVYNDDFERFMSLPLARQVADLVNQRLPGTNARAVRITELL